MLIRRSPFLVSGFAAKIQTHILLAIFMGGVLFGGGGGVRAQGSHGISAAGEGWPTYGGDPGGSRFSTSSQIDRGNVRGLHAVWTFHTHAVDSAAARDELPSFESTPVLWSSTLYFTSPFDVVFALDARTGAEHWHYDPKLKPLTPGGIVTSRGVALWPAGSAPASNAQPCSKRVFLGTLDARLLALDATSGQVCQGFGDGGSVDLTQGVHFQNIGFYGVTSPPTVVGNVVVVGSLVGDNQQVDSESGVVRGYDAVTGKLIWSWEPLPWAASQAIRTGAGNTWGVISADPALGLVYLPTGSASPDLWGGMRPGDNRDANSIVALDAKTGKKVWAFQVVHHDIWDYDVAAEPVLFTWRGSVPAVAVTTKMGMIFLLDRRDGRPLVPVVERPVPASDVPGEPASPTQPFQNLPTLAPLTLSTSESSSFRRPAADVELCSKQLAALRYEGIYTPASLRGTLDYPAPIGGVNWGGAALDPAAGILYANTNRSAYVIRLIPATSTGHRSYSVSIIGLLVRVFLSKKFWSLFFVLAALLLLTSALQRNVRLRRFAVVVLILGLGVFGSRVVYLRTRPSAVPQVDHFGYELSPQRKTPYKIERFPLVDSRGYNCSPAPWGAIAAVNLNTLTKLWEEPLGTRVPNERTGVRNFGGPIVTASGLVITAGTGDAKLRAFDAANGQELQAIDLPVSATSTPMTYSLDGRQYVVVAAGGHGDGAGAFGDSLIAFAVN